MIYLFQVSLLVFVLACTMRTEAFWPWSILSSGKSFIDLPPSLVAAGSGFVLYTLTNYSMLDYLLLIPGANYAIA